MLLADIQNLNLYLRRKYKLKTLSVNTVGITETEVGYEEKIIVLTICLSVLQLKELEWFQNKNLCRTITGTTKVFYYPILRFRECR